MKRLRITEAAATVFLTLFSCNNQTFVHRRERELNLLRGIKSQLKVIDVSFSLMMIQTIALVWFNGNRSCNTVTSTNPIIALLFLNQKTLLGEFCQFLLQHKATARIRIRSSKLLSQSLKLFSGNIINIEADRKNLELVALIEQIPSDSDGISATCFFSVAYEDNSMFALFKSRKIIFNLLERISNRGPSHGLHELHGGRNLRRLSCSKRNN